MIHIDLESHGFSTLLEKHEKYMGILIKKNYNEAKKSFSDEDENFFKNYLLDKNEDEDKKILKKLVDICVSPELKKIIKKFEKKCDELIKTEKSKEIIFGHINKIFSYGKFNYENQEWNRHIFISELGIDVCPYCNRNYITSYNKKRTTSDADHYYPKKKYPILQMNLYNLVPSCNVCNSKTKGDKDLKHLYPYLDSNNSLKFLIKEDKLSQLYAFNVNDINIEIKPINNVERAKNSIEVFKLDKIYEIHENVIFDLIQKIKNYENFDEDYYTKLLGEDIAIDIFRNELIYNNWFDFLNKDPLVEPLSKLKNDIFEQIKGI